MTDALLKVRDAEKVVGRVVAGVGGVVVVGRVGDQVARTGST
jgi:hypothetical protein